MTAAIFGLIGVVVGGVITGVTTWLLQHSQTKSATRAAARLTYDDFLHHQSTLVRAIDSSSWWEPEWLLPDQVDGDTRKLLLGQLGDQASQDVAGAHGWMSFLIGQRPAGPGTHPAAEYHLKAMCDTFCRLDRARWQLSGPLSGRTFRSFEDGGVLATLPRPRTLDDLGISDEHCLRRRNDGYGRETTAAR